MSKFGNKKIVNLAEELMEKVNEENLDYSLIPVDSTKNLLPKNGKERIAGHPIDTMLQENRDLDMILKEVRKLIRKLEKHDFPATWRELEEFVKDLKEIEFHYRRKDNLLLKFLEKLDVKDLNKNYSQYHKQAIKDINNLYQVVKIKNLKNVKFIFFPLNNLLRKIMSDEEFIIFPTALTNLSNKDWFEIREKGPSIGYAWSGKSKNFIKDVVKIEEKNSVLDGFMFDTGFLTLDSVNLIFDTMAAEITVINEDGLIIYYNKESYRVFDRSIDFIGKNFKDCFSPKNSKSISKVINDLKLKKMPYIEIWFPKNENQIYIKYLPLFDKLDNFKGIVEFIYDITKFKKIDGYYSSI